jgi:hypothetical protein
VLGRGVSLRGRAVHLRGPMKPPTSAYTAVVASAVLLAATVLYWQIPSVDTSSSVPTGLVIDLARTVRTGEDETRVAKPVAPEPENAVRPATDAADGALSAKVERKYKFLLKSVDTRLGNVALVRQLLLKREALISGVGQASNLPHTALEPAVLAQLADIDDIARLNLHPADYELYEALKTSDNEQHHLKEYMGGVQNIAPVSAEQEQAILQIKLKYKKRYDEMRQQAGIDRADLLPAERQYAFLLLAQALQEYKDRFLQEVQQYVTHEEQYALLRNYEESEFKQELERLKSALQLH